MVTGVQVSYNYSNRIISKWGVSGERRYAPLSFIGAVMDDTNKNQFRYLEHVDKGHIYDTDVAYGEPVILMESKGDDK